MKIEITKDEECHVYGFKPAGGSPLGQLTVEINDVRYQRWKDTLAAFRSLQEELGVMLRFLERQANK